MENAYVRKLMSGEEMRPTSLEYCREEAWKACIKAGEYELALAITEKYLLLRFGYTRGTVLGTVESTKEEKKGFLALLRRNK